MEHIPLSCFINEEPGLERIVCPRLHCHLITDSELLNFKVHILSFYSTTLLPVISEIDVLVLLPLMALMPTIPSRSRAKALLLFLSNNEI